MKHGEDIHRIIVLIILAICVWVILVLRVIQVQIISKGKYVERAKAQYIRELKLTSNRGIIYDRNLNHLAINKSVFSVGVDVKDVIDHQFASEQFAEFLGGNKNYYLKQLENGKNFFWLKRGVDEQMVQNLQTRGVTGLSIIPESKRFYPQNKLAAQLVGFTSVDMKGLSGVELVKDDILSGNSGWAKLQQDAFGKPVTDFSYSMKEPEGGKNVVLTIDNSIQLSAEEELQRTIDQYNAEGGTVIVSNPMTGEILAMAVIPTFNPNKAGDYPPDYWRNRAITDNFEPGSTFKPIFMSIIIEEDIKKPDDIVFCENGKYEIYDQTIEDISGYGWLTLTNIMAKSSNIGMSKLALELKKELIFQYTRAFGFGVRTGIELSGEVAGDLINTIEWSKNTPIAMSRGYEVSVTPLQMVMAYGALANGGKLLRPIIFYDESDNGKNEKKKIKPNIIRRVVSENTSKTIVSMLEDVVKNGTGNRAQIPDLRIAGKTGTAWKYDIVKQTYSNTEFIASFIGFFPIEKPELLIYVMIDNPKEEYLGGVVAASTFKRIAQRARRILDLDLEYVEKQRVEDNIRQDDEIQNEKRRLPNLVLKKEYVAEKILDDMGLSYDTQNDGQFIIDQSPAAGTMVSSKTPITLTLSKLNDDDGNNNGNKYTRVPKVIGLSIRDALNKFSKEGLHVLVQGSGRVVKQSPSAGEKIRKGARCVVECEPIIDLTAFRQW